MQLTYRKIMKIRELLTTSHWLTPDLNNGFKAPQLGIAPFEGENGLELARIILKNIHLLEIREFGIIPEVANAIREMIKENFHDLYTQEMQNILGIEGYTDNCDWEGDKIKDLLEGKKIDFEKFYLLK